jgi:molecular chaperone GrpE
MNESDSDTVRDDRKDPDSAHEDGNVEVEFIEANAEAATDSRSDSAHTAETQKPQPEESSVETELAQTKDRLLRLAAEFDNFKKRTARQFTAIVENAQTEILADLLSVQDNLERALAVDQSAADYASLKRGIGLIAAQIGHILKKNGVEAFESRGKQFDPNLHEAVMTVKTPDVAEHSVVDEFAKGYKYKDRVLRHAKVSVADSGE